jgi:hypothetical protein
MSKTVTKIMIGLSSLACFTGFANYTHYHDQLIRMQKAAVYAEATGTAQAAPNIASAQALAVQTSDAISGFSNSTAGSRRPAANHTRRITTRTRAS